MCDRTQRKKVNQHTLVRQIAQAKREEDRSERSAFIEPQSDRAERAGIGLNQHTVVAQFTRPQPERAEQAGISRRQQQKLDALARHEDQDGGDTLLKRVRRGELSVHAAYVAAGLGTRTATRERMAWLRQQVTNLLNPALGGVGRPAKGNVVIHNISGGDDPDYIIRRLKRDDEKLATRVIAGEVSAHAASEGTLAGDGHAGRNSVGPGRVAADRR